MLRPLRSKWFANGQPEEHRVDTQRTLPFGTPDEVRREVRERIKIFGPGGGFVFAAVHNIQACTPVENILAMFETVRECGRYPLGA